jgi:transposase
MDGCVGAKMSARAAERTEPEALRQIRQSAQALVAQGKTEEAWDLVIAALEALLAKNRDLELLVQKLQRSQTGRKSERVDPAQLTLLLESFIQQGGLRQPLHPEAEALKEAQLDREIAIAEGVRSEPKRRRGRTGAGWSGQGIERHVHRVEIDEAQRVCERCGRTKQCIGHDVTRRLVYVPAHFEEHEYQLVKYGCGLCKDGVLTAAAPAQVLARSAVGGSVLSQLLVSKFSDHTPLHRMRRIWSRSGLEVAVSTLSDWNAGAAEVLEALGEPLAKRVLDAYIVRTDATGLRVLDPQEPTNVHMGTIWAYVGDDRDVLFRYTPTGEGATGPWEFLAGREGYIQADASNVFDRLYNGRAARGIEIGCWAHGRRRLVALRDTDCRVAYPLKLIAGLYRIEHLADARALSAEERGELRRERCPELLEKLKGWVLLTLSSEPPSTELAQTAGYLSNHWEALTRFVGDGRVSLDNNVCEQQLRDIALGRKNYLFAGSHDAARRAATVYSLTRTCAQYGVPPFEYFTDVLRKIADGWDRNRLDELLPHRWRSSASAPRNPSGP